MERLALTRLVDAGFRIPAVLAQIADMAQQIPVRVLRSRTAQMGADTDEDRRRQFFTQPVNGKAAQHFEADAVDERLAQRFQSCPQRGYDEVVGCQPRKIGMPGEARARGRLQFGDIRRRQAPSPGFGDATDVLPEPARGDVQSFRQTGRNAQYLLTMRSCLCSDRAC